MNDQNCATLGAAERQGRNLQIENEIRNVQDAIRGLEDLAVRLGAYSRAPEPLPDKNEKERPPKLAETLEFAPPKLEGAASMIRELTDALGSNLL